MGLFTLKYTEIKVVGELFWVKSFFVVFHEIWYVGMSGYFRQVCLVLCFLQVMFGAVVFVMFAQGFFLH